jgi:argininosuccinate lyase/amino-acid N-acetyltransferase
MPAERGAVWSGRIAAPLDPRAAKLNDSLPVDGRLLPEELALTRAWSEALCEIGVMDAAGRDALHAACDALDRDVRAGTVTLAGEDVHTAVEQELVRRAGDPALRLHTGRSRNDQVATLMRMRTMALCDKAVERIAELERAIAKQARASEALPVAAQTHMQPAQPVLMAHLWLAHIEAYERDETRFLDAREEADRMPLGAGAVAGTPLPVQRPMLAMRLGFHRVAENSVDAVGDRDFVMAYLNAAAVLGVHLSRMAEDLVLWCSPLMGWYRAPDGFSTGSSLLPQKRNPDIFELTRGKSARLIANAQRIAVLMKGLPSSYQKDLQEDKEALFDSADTLDALLSALAPAIEALEPVPAKMAESLTDDLLAVELADALVEAGVPFREAHAAVGRLWGEAERQAVRPAEVPDEARLAISPHFTAAQMASLSVESSLARRNHSPGGGPEAVARQLARAEGRLGLGPGLSDDTHTVGGATAPAAPVAPAATDRTGAAGPARAEQRLADGTVLRAARIDDVPGIAALMADYVLQGTLLPRPVSELYHCVREFQVAEKDGAVVACAALRLLWSDLGEVRSLAVRPDHHGKGLGAALVQRVIADARVLQVPRVIALTREVAFFERCGFHTETRDLLPRKVWTDCVRCPRRHACDEVAVVMDLQPGASKASAAAARAWMVPIPHGAPPEPNGLPVVS